MKPTQTWNARVQEAMLWYQKKYPWKTGVIVQIAAMNRAGRAVTAELKAEREKAQVSK